MNDKSIINALLADNKNDRSKALSEIYRSCYPKIESFVLKNSGILSYAEDVFQDAMMLFFQNVKANKFRGESKIETYIYSIAKNLWFQQLRKEKKNETMITLDEDDQQSQINSTLINDVLSQLGESCQKILIEFYYKKMTIREIQVANGINSEQVVKNKKGRCLNYLTKLMKDKGLSLDKFYNE